MGSNRDSTPSKKMGITIYFAFFAVALGAVATVLLYRGIYPNIRGDGHSYFELSQHIFQGEFYRTNQWRQFEYSQPYGVTYPPLWPIIIAAFNKIFEAGLSAGLFINCLLSIATLFVLLRLGAKVFSLPIFGFALYCALAGNHEYWGEVANSGSIPLQVLMLSSIFYVYFSHATFGLRHIIIMGTIAGLMMLNRNDSMLLALLLGVAVLKYANLRKWQAGVVYYASLGLINLPWWVHNMRIFGRPLVSENSHLILYAKRIDNHDFFINKPPTVFEQPVTWMHKFFDNSMLELQITGKELISDPTLMCLIVILFATYRMHSRNNNSISSPINETTRQYILYNSRKAVWLAPVFIGQLAVIILASFLANRYYIPIKFYLVLLLLLALLGICRDGCKEYSNKASYIVTGVAFLFILIINYSIIHNAGGIKATWFLLNEDRMVWQKSRFKEIEQCMGNEKFSSKLFILDNQVADSIELTALTGIASVEMPYNLTIDNVDILEPLIRRFAVTHVVVSKNQYLNEINKSYQLKKICALPIYKLLPRS
jgi:hypothetical protein